MNQENLTNGYKQEPFRTSIPGLLIVLLFWNLFAGIYAIILRGRLEREQRGLTPTENRNYWLFFWLPNILAFIGYMLLVLLVIAVSV